MLAISVGIRLPRFPQESILWDEAITVTRFFLKKKPADEGIPVPAMLLVRNTLFENPWHVSQLKRRFYPEATAIILGLSPGLLAGDGPVRLVLLMGLGNCRRCETEPCRWWHSWEAFSFQEQHRPCPGNGRAVRGEDQPVCVWHPRAAARVGSFSP